MSSFPSQSVYNYRSSHATGNSDKIVHIFHLALGWENRQKTGGAHDIRLFFKILPDRNNVLRRITNVPFLLTIFDRYNRRRTCPGRRTLHLLIGATGSDYEVSYPCDCLFHICKKLNYYVYSPYTILWKQVGCISHCS